jgi:4-nitrophenyl phosphatase
MKFSHAFFDLDGTVYVEGKLIPGVLEGLNKLRLSGTKIYYMTNNTSVSVSNYYSKLAEFGLPLKDGCVISPTLTLAKWLNELEYERFYPVATSSFTTELISLTGIKRCDLDPQVVVVAFDRELDYSKLSEACRFINSGIPWVVTHIDLACPSQAGPIPDCGAIAKLLSSTTGIDHIADFGKPSKYMRRMIQGISNDSSTILVAGDRLYTDIQIGVDLGATTVVVCSGEFQKGDTLTFTKKQAQVHDSLADYLCMIT